MNKIVACVDGAGYTEAVCDYAVWAAQRLQVPLEFLHVLEKTPDARLDASGSIGLGEQESLLAELAALDERRSTLAREHGRRILEAVYERALAAGASSVEVRQRHGELVDTLLELQDDTRLYVMGQHDYEQKPKRFLLDHNVEGAVRTLQRPILVATAQFKAPRSFMIAFDGSATGRKMVDMVADSPILRGLRCSIVMVGDDSEALKAAEFQLIQAGFQVDTHQLEGEAVDTLLAFAEREQLDMLVMGAYGHSRIRHLVVGSTTTAILRRTHIPAFVLR